MSQAKKVVATLPYSTYQTSVAVQAMLLKPNAELMVGMMLRTQV
jgi:hypothetical protein